MIGVYNGLSPMDFSGRRFLNLNCAPGRCEIIAGRDFYLLGEEYVRSNCSRIRLLCMRVLRRAAFIYIPRHQGLARKRPIRLQRVLCRRNFGRYRDIKDCISAVANRSALADDDICCQTESRPN
jgi:hypothetical protein